jgi:predicted Fe-Mo cluster-binding NifX family protein
MKVCISSNGIDLRSPVEPRFGRCKYFIFLDTETMNFECKENPAFTAGGGAGIQASQMVVHNNAKAVLTGDVGPNAFQVLQAGGINIVTGVTGSIKEAVERFKKGEFQYAGNPSVQSHAGMRR